MRALLHAVVIGGWVAAAVMTAGCAPRAALRTETGEGEAETGARAPLAETVPTTLLVATALFEAGEYQQALPYYEHAFEQDPGDVEIGLRYARAALHAGQANQSLEILARLQELHPEELEVGLQRSRLHLYMGDLAAADSLAAEVLAYHANEPAALRLRLETLEQLEKYPEAAVLAGRLADLGEDEPARLLVRQSRLLLQAGEAAPAEAALRRALELDPTHEEAAELLADLLARTQRVDEVLPLLEELVARTPGSGAHRMALADAHLARGEVSKAVEVLSPLASTGELDGKSQLLLGQLLSMLDRPEEAWTLVERSMAEGFEGPLALRLAGDIQVALGDLEQGEDYLRRALAARPGDVETLISLMMLTARTHPTVFEGDSDLPAAVRDEFGDWLDTAAERADENNVRQSFLVGALLRRAARDEEAVRLLSRASEMDPDNPQILFDLAVSQEATGRYREAQSTLETLLEIDPQDAQVLNYLGYLLADRGWELARAETLVEKALAQDPENAFYLDSLGWVYYRTGRYEDALEKLIDASNVLGDDPTVLEHIGDTLVALERYERALSVYLRALEVGGDRDDLEPRIEDLRQRLREAP